MASSFEMTGNHPDLGHRGLGDINDLPGIVLKKTGDSDTSDHEIGLVYPRCTRLGVVTDSSKGSAAPRRLKKAGSSIPTPNRSLVLGCCRYASGFVTQSPKGVLVDSPHLAVPSFFLDPQASRSGLPTRPTQEHLRYVMMARYILFLIVLVFLGSPSSLMSQPRLHASELQPLPEPVRCKTCFDLVPFTYCESNEHGNQDRPMARVGWSL
ncbi:hypothetical protein NMY22_g19530 [Coprinellus aureogranulatus]|nr:hypothetical protein NMY22_g19530 [Coprinellus aureogranulatus]